MKAKFWIPVIAIFSIIALVISQFFVETKAQNLTGGESNDEQLIIPVLMYHHFVEPDQKGSYTTVTSKEFEKQIKYLKKKGYTAITDQDLLNYYYNNQPLPEKPIHITMDDGYESNYKLAYPILKKHGMKATIFLIVSRTENGIDYDIPRLTWDQLKEMSDEGVMSIQSHTYDLHHKDNVDGIEVSAAIANNNEEHYQKLVHDFRLSKQLIEEKLGKEVISLSYPYGDYDANTILAAKNSGIKLAYTVQTGLNRIDINPYELMRINVPSGWSGNRIEREIKAQKRNLTGL